MASYPPSTNPMLNPLIIDMSNKLEDCYPLEPYTDSVPLPLFTLSDDVPIVPELAFKVSDDEYYLWLTEIIQKQGIDELLKSNRLSDLRRLYYMLEKAHRRVHHMIEQASLHPNSVVSSTYLVITLLHSGVESLMRQVLDRAKLVASRAGK